MMLIIHHLDMLRAAIARFLTTVRRSRIISKLKDLAAELRQIEMLREHDNRLERQIYKDQAELLAELRDMDRPLATCHDTEMMVD